MQRVCVCRPTRPGSAWDPAPVCGPGYKAATGGRGPTIQITTVLLSDTTATVRKGKAFVFCWAPFYLLCSTFITNLINLLKIKWSVGNLIIGQLLDLLTLTFNSERSCSWTKTSSSNVAFSSQSVSAANCGDFYFFICYHDNRGASDYTFINTSLTWSGAHQYCQNQNADLAVMDKDHDLISALSQQDFPVWTGLYRDGNKPNTNSLYSSSRVVCRFFGLLSLCAFCHQLTRQVCFNKTNSKQSAALL